MFGNRIVDGSVVDDDDPFVVATEEAQTASGAVVVIVGRNLDLVVETVGALRRNLFVAIPLVLLIVGFTTWKVVGRSLAPVEAIRRGVTDISASQLHRRVPEPEGDDEMAAWPER